MTGGADDLKHICSSDWLQERRTGLSADTSEEIWGPGIRLAVRQPTGRHCPCPIPVKRMITAVDSGSNNGFLLPTLWARDHARGLMDAQHGSIFETNAELGPWKHQLATIEDDP